MGILKFDPFKELAIIQERMNKLFEQTAIRSRGQREAIGTSSWTPAIDVYETDKELIIEAELPGMSKDDIELTAKENRLIIKGKRGLSRDADEDNYIRIERAYGSFSRTFGLPDNVDTDKIAAEHKKGVLTVKIALRDSMKGTIEVE